MPIEESQPAPQAPGVNIAAPAQAVVVDVDAKRHELLGLLADLLRGKEDPSAIAKIRPHKGQRLANLLSICEKVGQMNPADGARMAAMEHWVANILKANLRTRQEIFRVAENLSKPGEEKSLLDRMLRRN